MKNILFLCLLVFFNNSYADIYKCTTKGKPKYQSAPCKNGERFTLKVDISKKQQQQALAKLNNELSTRKIQQKNADNARDKERLIRAEEAKAYEYSRQADAAEKSNNIEIERLRRKNRRKEIQVFYSLY